MFLYETFSTQNLGPGDGFEFLLVLVQVEVWNVTNKSADHQQANLSWTSVTKMKSKTNKHAESVKVIAERDAALKGPCDIKRVKRQETLVYICKNLKE